MRQGSAKILMLLGFLILMGLAFVFFTGGNSEKQAAPEKANAAPKSGINTQIVENENEIYKKKLTEFKEITFKLNQKDLKLFKEQTKEAFNLLAELIDELPQSSETKSEVKENTTELKKVAGQIALFDNEEKIVELLKKGFTVANDAIDKATGDVDEEKKPAKKFLENIEKKFDVMENKVKKITMKNYKSMTKELLMDFHSLIRYMNKEMKNSDIMITSASTKEDADNNNDAEQKVSKTDKDQKQAMTKKEETAKKKNSCDCKANMKDDKDNKKN